MSLARSYAIRSPWIVTLLLTAACTGVIGAPTAVQSEQSVATTDGGEAPPRTDEEDPAAPSGDGGAVRRGASKQASDGGARVASQRSAGCAKAAKGTGSWERRSVRIGERDRTYYVYVPASYDPKRAYPVVFRFHGSGGDGMSGGLDIERVSGDDAIVVGADGVNRTWTGGTQSEDLQLFDTMFATLSASHCLDLTRVFSYGFSAGAGFTNLLGCVRASALRGTASIAGFDRGTDPRCAEQPMAAWFQHDKSDPSVPIASGRSARDRVLKRDDCSTETRTADGCTTYTGCDQGEPVVWCETDALGHDIDGSRAPAKVWRFFSTLP